MRRLRDFDYRGKKVLLRLDINSPIDSKTKRIVNFNRLDQSLPTLETLIERGAAIAIIAHQGDTLDYQNLQPLDQQAEYLSEKLQRPVVYLDDVAGDAALAAVRKLQAGELILLGNLRYLSEEVSTFENYVKLTPEAMTQTYLVRRLAPLFDYYVNDAFAAAHRSAPSMVAFQEVLPCAAGVLFDREYHTLKTILEKPNRPCVYLLGGAKISDAFGMMHQVLAQGSADQILTAGITGLVFLLASGQQLGETTWDFLRARSLEGFVEEARQYLQQFPEQISYPLDLAYEDQGVRREGDASALPKDVLFYDIGEQTIARYRDVIAQAGTVFVNGPAGVYEQPLFERGTKALMQALAQTKAFTVIGGGDSVTAATKYVDLNDIDYICTAGGAMVRFLSGKELPLVRAMNRKELS